MNHVPRYAVNCSILFTELPLLERPAAAKAAGFDAVEFWWPFSEIVPDDHQVEEFVTAIDQAGVDLIALNFASGNPANGDRGILSLPGRRSEFRDNVDAVVNIGQRLGTKAFNAPFGNRLDDVEAAEQDELAVENLALAARKVGEIGAVVLLEPLSGAPRYPLLTAADAAKVIEQVENTTGQRKCSVAGRPLSPDGQWRRRLGRYLRLRRADRARSDRGCARSSRARFGPPRF